MSSVSYLKKEYSDEELHKVLHPLVEKWFKQSFETFSPPQRLSMMDIHSRKNILVSAPTGSGKTLTAFLSVLNELVDSSEKGILQDKMYAVYISPLKALNNDIERNLLKPLEELNTLAGKDLGIRVAVRTGDTTAYQKQKMLKKPPHILITTPESLGIILASKKFSEKLHTVDWCIIDEIHSLAENKRGVHLSLSMERLQCLSPAMSRVGLSATVAPLEEVAKFLVGHTRDVGIVDVQFLKKYDLELFAPVKNLIDTPHYVMQNALYSQLHDMIQDHKTTIIFTNTRAGTERVIDNLKNRFPKFYGDNIAAHHGSMGKSMRLRTELALKEGRLKVCSSSTSLELGIDIGTVDLVICLNSPKSVARFLQRVGRAGHQLHETVKGRLITMDRDNLVECALMLKNAVDKVIDRIHIPTLCLDVLAQQIAGMALEKVWDEEELFTTIKKSYCYADLSKKDFSQILNYLAGTFVDLEQRYIFAKIWRDNGKIGKRGKMSRVIYMTNIGTIPSESHITVKIKDHVIGKLDEGFLEKMRTGDVFTLGGATYEFRYSRGMVAQVRATPQRPPTVPSWVSEQLPLSFDLAKSIAKFRRLVGDKLQKNVSKNDVLQFIQDYVYVKEPTAEALYHYFKEQQDFCMIPHDKLLLIEDFNDEDSHKIIFHSLFGRRVNDCLSRAIAFIISRKTGKDVEMGVNDNGFYISGVPSIRIQEVLKLLHAEKLELLMNAALEKTEIYKRRFRHCAARAFMILRNYKGRTKSAGRQQVSSMILMSALKDIDNNFSILREAKREVLYDLMDIDNAQRVLRDLEMKKIVVKEVKTRIPSPFAFAIALQGRMDILKMEDKHDFLRRMHSYVLAKIGASPDVMIVDEPQEFYEKTWKKEEQKLVDREKDVKVLLMEDARRAMKKLRMPRDFLMNLYMMINDETEGYRQDFLVWLDENLTGDVPLALSDRLVKFLRDKKEELKIVI